MALEVLQDAHDAVGYVGAVPLLFLASWFTCFFRAPDRTSPDDDRAEGKYRPQIDGQRLAPIHGKCLVYIIVAALVKRRAWIARSV